MSGIDYRDVTEAHGNQITREALEMMCTRYLFAAHLSEGRDVLEVACGAGQGLGVLRGHARRVVGADYTHGLLEMARSHYDGRVPLARVDAQRLPFRSGSFDVVVLYEALYYLAQPQAFVAEARRVLRPAGRLMICTVNREWADFNPSPFSTVYHSAAELRTLLEEEGFATRLFAAFPVGRATIRDRAVSAVKQFAVAFGLVPKTMRGKRLLKRVFLGRLVSFPPEIRGDMAAYREPVPLTAGGPVDGYKVVYAIGAV
jgi:SAM-dependent methyltransferase